MSIGPPYSATTASEPRSNSPTKSFGTICLSTTPCASRSVEGWPGRPSRLIEDEREDFDKRSCPARNDCTAGMLDSQDMGSSRRAARARIACACADRICNQLETEKHFHAKLSVLAGYRQCLQPLVACSGDARLREEPALAHNSRADSPICAWVQFQTSPRRPGARHRNASH